MRSLVTVACSTYDVIFLSSPLGARSNPLVNWKHAVLCYWVVGAPETIGASFRGLSTYKSASLGPFRVLSPLGLENALTGDVESWDCTCTVSRQIRGCYFVAASLLTILY